MDDQLDERPIPVTVDVELYLDVPVNGMAQTRRRFYIEEAVHRILFWQQKALMMDSCLTYYSVTGWRFAPVVSREYEQGEVFDLIEA